MMESTNDIVTLFLEKDLHDSICVEEVRVACHEVCHTPSFDLSKYEVLVSPKGFFDHHLVGCAKDRISLHYVQVLIRSRSRLPFILRHNEERKLLKGYVFLFFCVS